VVSSGKEVQIFLSDVVTGHIGYFPIAVSYTFDSIMEIAT
jgi:hypothetical protein